MSESARRCPRCDQLNQCAQAASTTPVSDCWCFNVAIAPAVLADLPSDTSAQSCLCQACAQALNAANHPD